MGRTGGGAQWRGFQDSMDTSVVCGRGRQTVLDPSAFDGCFQASDLLKSFAAGSPPPIWPGIERARCGATAAAAGGCMTSSLDLDAYFECIQSTAARARPSLLRQQSAGASRRSWGLDHALWYLGIDAETLQHIDRHALLPWTYNNLTPLVGGFF